MESVKTRLLYFPNTSNERPGNLEHTRGPVTPAPSLCDGVKPHPRNLIPACSKTQLLLSHPNYEINQAAAADVTHRRALKAALNSCVRLCVVAPTVNINLDERSRSFCSGLPEEKIRAFVEGSVLPRFTRVLLQPGSEGEAGGDESTSVGRRWRRRRPSTFRKSGGGGGDGGGVNNNKGTAALHADNATIIPAVTSGLPPSSSSPSSSSSSSCALRRGQRKALAVGSSTASAATAVDNPAVDKQQFLAESDDDEFEADNEDGGGGGRGGGGGSSGSGSGQGQGNFDKWLRDLLVDMQTSIERHVASVFQTQTAAVVS